MNNCLLMPLYRAAAPEADGFLWVKLSDIPGPVAAGENEFDVDHRIGICSCERIGGICSRSDCGKRSNVVLTLVSF